MSLNTISNEQIGLFGQLADYETALEHQLADRIKRAGDLPVLLGGNCLKATILLQTMFAENGVETIRMRGEPFMNVVAGREIKDLWHCVLRLKEDGTLIDPTYGQFLDNAGVDMISAAKHTKLLQRHIALIPEGQEEYFGQRFVEYAKYLRQKWPRKRKNSWQVSVRSVDDAAIADIWNSDNYYET